MCKHSLFVGLALRKQGLEGRPCTLPLRGTKGDKVQGLRGGCVYTSLTPKEYPLYKGKTPLYAERGQRGGHAQGFWNLKNL